MAGPAGLVPAPMTGTTTTDNYDSWTTTRRSQYYLCRYIKRIVRVGGCPAVVVVWLSSLSGTALTAQGGGVLGSIPSDCWPYHSLFLPHNN